MMKHKTNRDERRENAEAIALQALAFLAGEPELLPRFLALTGIEPSQIRTAAAEPGFLAGVLSFFLAHEPSLTKLSETLDIDAAQIALAARVLPAGDDSHERSI